MLFLYKHVLGMDLPWFSSMVRAKRPVPDAFGAALLLSPAAGAGSLAMIELSLGGRAPEPLALPALEPVRRAIPTARALPLLQRVARREAGEDVLEYLDGLSLAVGVTPCA